MNDDEYGAVLLRPLDVEPAGAPRIDVARAMREGGRMRRRRWAFGGGFLAAIVAALVTGSLLISPATPHKPVLPPDPPLPKSCTVVGLPTGKYHSAEVIGGDSTGRWQFGRSNPYVDTGPQHILVWHDGALAGDAALPGFKVNPRSINSSGVIVGEADDKKSGIRPYVYRNGTFSPLKGGVGEAAEINDGGVIVGRLGDDAHPVAVRWRSADADPERMPMPAGSHINSYNLAIAPDGTVAAIVIRPAPEPVTGPSGPAGSPSSSPSTETYLWLPDGTTRQIKAPPPAGDPTATVDPLTFRHGWFYAEQVIGGKLGEQVVVEGVRLIRYDPVSGVWQKIGDEKPADAVQLPAAGRSFAGAGSPTPRVYVGSRVLELPMTMPLADPDVDAATVQSISDDAHTVTGYLTRGAADVPPQPYRPVIWHCE